MDTLESWHGPGHGVAREEKLQVKPLSELQNVFQLCTRRQCQQQLRPSQRRLVASLGWAFPALCDMETHAVTWSENKSLADKVRPLPEAQTIQSMKDFDTMVEHGCVEFACRLGVWRPAVLDVPDA